MDRRKELHEIERRQLTSVMNNTKWEELRRAVATTFPFELPYQIKYVLEDTPNPEFLADQSGDWEDGFPYPTSSIEWIRLRPKVLVYKGTLVEPDVYDLTDELISILTRERIPFVQDNATLQIFGYVRDTGIFEPKHDV
ncbi:MULTISPECIES: DUF6678 family protein [Exiguobacterium]|uniref:DUF6678 family protein n=1 Tax=Exiguobacterium TaxID=33986 RepID=UPI001BE6B3AC|nr:MULTISPECIES: DUF6678 family protein [Exiguobacterium]MCT4776645.1 hypothetical protein [Exiguobacterium aquaticum]MCT4787861.1 hypothetical protein [Exiguobacterium mexicanum]